MAGQSHLSASRSTLLAAREFTRRSLLRRAAATTTLATGPWFVEQAFSSSGELNVLHRGDELRDSVLPDFAAKTGIKVNATPFSENDEQIKKLRDGPGDAFDLCQPSRELAPRFKDLEVLQPLDTGRLSSAPNFIPAIADGSTSVWTWDSKLYFVPHLWGSEAIAWRTDQTTLEFKDLSYRTLWNDEYKGKVQGRPHSLLLGIGLWLDAAGKLPTNRLSDAFKDEDSLKKAYDVIIQFAVEHKPWIRQFWSTTENTMSGFMENGCAIGQTWDGPALALKTDGKPVTYMAPQEGAIVWVDGWAMAAGAKNVEQAYAFISYLQTPEVNAKAAAASNYNPVIAGSDALLPDAAKKNFADAYPEDALKKLWLRPLEWPWFAELRTAYAERLRAA